MLYSVAEVSDTIGVSKQSIYNKMKLKELEEHISKKQGITYIDEVGLNLIRNSLNTTTDDLNCSENESENNGLDEESATCKEDSTLDKEFFNLLKEQLKEKDIQIHELHKLIENNQVLLKDKPQDIKLLEQHFQDLDDKIMNIKERNIPHKKGLFNKWFKK